MTNEEFAQLVATMNGELTKAMALDPAANRYAKAMELATDAIRKLHALGESIPENYDRNEIEARLLMMIGNTPTQ